ncbi:MAG: hypothetical protein HZB59_07685 [Ignavibacteriales bacterium]|nr:hypothetical protein [Ignavibacteriales bacterium]
MNRSFKIFPYFYILTFLVFHDFIISQNKYHSYDEMTKLIHASVSSHKDIAKVESIAKTIENRDIWAIAIGGKDADSRHAILVLGGVEAERIIGSELSVRFINFLLDNYGKVDSITQLVNSSTFYILPRVNPDASEEFFRKPLNERTLNAHPTDNDRDGILDEDGFEDLNGDGFITMMRVKDNRGEWIPHQNDPRILRKADPSKGEIGLYKLFTEGIDNDIDEQWNEDDRGGVDFNRNFPHNYQFFSKGAGPYQISEVESRAVTEFCFSHPNIAAVFTFSSNDNLMNPWKKEQKQGPPPSTEERSGRRRIMDDEESAPRLITSVLDEDEQYFNFISKQYQEITKFKGAPQSTKGEGAFSEWAYYHFGRWSFSVNPWWIPEIGQKKDTSTVDSTKIKKENDKKGIGDENKIDLKKGKGTDEKPDEYTGQLNALKWLDANGIKDGFINWTKIKHKDFPDNDVEVGGFKPYIQTNPPADSIGTIAEKENTFLAWLGSKLPAIEIKDIKIKSLDNKVYRVTASIVNNGYLPTNSAMGSKARWQRNVKVSIGLSKDQKLSAGKLINIISPIKGSGGSQELTWLIVSAAGEKITISAESPVSGSSIQIITLK